MYSSSQQQCLQRISCLIVTCAVKKELRELRMGAIRLLEEEVRPRLSCKDLASLTCRTCSSDEDIIKAILEALLAMRVPIIQTCMHKLY